MVKTTDFDEQYAVDHINRLTTMKRGTLNGSHVIPGTAGKQEDWTLDAVGNWKGYENLTSGATDLNQTRTANKVNEITDITTTSGTDWATPGYDAAGNMTAFVKPTDLTSNLTAVYDAWNRLVAVKDGTNFVAQYTYDGLTRRVVKQAYDSSGTLTETRHCYFSDQWQIVREMVSGSTAALYIWVCAMSMNSWCATTRPMAGNTPCRMRTSTALQYVMMRLEPARSMKGISTTPTPATASFSIHPGM